MKYSIVFFIVVASLFVSNLQAHESVLNYNQISLEASASAEVGNDTMIVSMYAMEEGSHAVELSNKVNKKVNWALEKLKPYKNIKVETTNYSTSPVYNKSQIIAWRVQQSIQLESGDMTLMSEVLGDLQQQLKLNGVSFDVSREKTQQHTQALIERALVAFTERATRIANQLKKDGYKIVNMNVSTSAGGAQYKYRAMNAMMAEAAPAIAPEVAGGEKTLSVRVNGTIELE